MTNYLNEKKNLKTMYTLYIVQCTYSMELSLYYILFEHVTLKSMKLMELKVNKFKVILSKS